MHMQKPVVLITTPWIIPGEDVHTLIVEAGYEVRFSSGGLRAALSTQNPAGIKGIIAGTDLMGAETLSSIPNLKVIARTGVGYDNIDVEFASMRNITVCNTPGVNFRSVAEFTIAQLLNLSRQIPRNITELKQGIWQQDPGIELYKKSLGVLGFGEIGRAVARIGKALGMQVLTYDPHLNQRVASELGAISTTFEGLLKRSDFVTLHMNLTDRTRNLIGEQEFALMKTDAFLINVARGGIV